jgi:hypothetical protein
VLHLPRQRCLSIPLGRQAQHSQDRPSPNHYDDMKGVCRSGRMVGRCALRRWQGSQTGLESHGCELSPGHPPISAPQQPRAARRTRAWDDEEESACWRTDARFAWHPVAARRAPGSRPSRLARRQPMGPTPTFVAGHRPRLARRAFGRRRLRWTEVARDDHLESCPESA